MGGISPIDAFDTSRRLKPKYFNLEGNSSPTFKCIKTSESFGGSYSLKAGLITSDEIVAAGGQDATNTSFYLYNGVGFWSMSPSTHQVGSIFVSTVNENGRFDEGQVDVDFGPRLLLRPVINLRADVVFKEGTDGSVATPYELAE